MILRRDISGGLLTPYCKSGGAVEFEDFTSDEMVLNIEMIVDRGMEGGEFLEGLHITDFSHRPFPTSERLK